MSIRITCINKAGGYHEDPHEAIQWLGWVEDGTGKQGKMARESMHDWIKQGGQAYVASGSTRVRVVAETNSRGTKYVRTVPNYTTSDNLLSLRECA